MLKITNRILKAEAERRGWLVRVIDECNGFLEYTLPNGKKFVFQSSLTPFIPATTLRIADNKKVLYELANEYGVRVPETKEILEPNDIISMLERYKKLVIKPIDGAHGNGVVTDIKSKEEAQRAIVIAKGFSDRILVQQQVSGRDLRLLFINYELAAACIRKPAFVIGNGEKSVSQLIDAANNSGKRAENYMKSLNLIDKESALRFLGDKKDYIPQLQEEVIVVGTANIGTGGEAIDITNSVPVELIASGQKIMRLLNMPLGAVDFMGEGAEYYLLEINAVPSFGLHLYPSSGESQPVDKHFFNWVESEAK